MGGIQNAKTNVPKEAMTARPWYFSRWPMYTMAVAMRDMKCRKVKAFLISIFCCSCFLQREREE